MVAHETSGRRRNRHRPITTSAPPSGDALMAKPVGGGLADADEAGLGERELALLALGRGRLGDAELDVGLAGVLLALGLQAALAAGLGLVEREHGGLGLAVADDRVAVALQPRLGDLARALLGELRRSLAVGELLRRDPQRVPAGALVRDLEHGRRLVDADELGLERGRRGRVSTGLRLGGAGADRGEGTAASGN